MSLYMTVVFLAVCELSTKYRTVDQLDAVNVLTISLAVFTYPRMRRTILVFIYFSIVSAPGHFCIAALYKFSMYCIVLLYCIVRRTDE